MTPSKTIAMFLPHLDVSGGLGVHCRTLVAALAEVASLNRYTIYAPERPEILFPATAPEPLDRESFRLKSIEFHSLPIPKGFNLAHSLDPLLDEPLNLMKPDTLYCSYYTGMAKPPCRQIVAFHDAGFLENPAGFGETAVIRKRTIESIRKSIDILQCISFDARDRICKRLPWDAAKTAVVWHALPDSQAEINAACAIPANAIRFGGESLSDWTPYFFLPVGAATGFNRVRKNVPTAVKAFRELKEGRLLIAGTAELTEKVLRELLPESETGTVVEGRWHSADGRVVIVPTLPRREFLAAMHHAAAVVYPSRYEGFGLPCIEAMAVGTPLIAANATSLPEVVADAGILIDPDHVAGFTAAMRSAIAEPDRMKALIAKGCERRSRFTLDRLGREMIALFD